MEAYRLKMKVAEHEFDATGPTELVQAQFATFTALIASVMTAAGDVVTMGRGRARRYRLTSQGVAKAQRIARSVII